MVSRGFIELRTPPRPGLGREFSKNELAEIMVIDALISLGIDVGSTEMMRFMPLKIRHYHDHEPMLLLVRRHGRLIPTSDRGSPRRDAKDESALRFGTMLTLENSNHSGLIEVLADRDLIGVCVVRLLEILTRADAGVIVDATEL
jgi:hypothetical protein